MLTVTFIKQCLNQAYQRLKLSLDGLDQLECDWRPAPHANSIGEILFHLVRSEDRTVRRRLGLGTELWTSQGWNARFGYHGDRGETRDFDLLRNDGAWQPCLRNLKDYLAAVHKDTLEKLETLSSDDLDRPIDPDDPERTIGSFLRHLITHNNNHHGQIDYLRGLRQPSWDLAPGTGFVQR